MAENIKMCWYSCFTKSLCIVYIWRKASLKKGRQSFYLIVCLYKNFHILFKKLLEVENSKWQMRSWTLFLVHHAEIHQFQVTMMMKSCASLLYCKFLESDSIFPRIESFSLKITDRVNGMNPKYFITLK